MPTNAHHGSSLSLEAIETMIGGGPPPAEFALEMPLVPGPALALNDFEFLFDNLITPANQLPVGNAANRTIKKLSDLGDSIGESIGDQDSSIPAAYIFFGQFIDHDVTLEAVSESIQTIDDDDFTPIPKDTILNKIKNMRSSALDLDSVYMGAPRVNHKMTLGRVTQIGHRPPGKDDFNDLPRAGKVAQIGDARNDENIIISQLHLAVLRFHNAMVDRGMTFTDAQRATRQHYHSVVIHDFLPRVTMPGTVDNLLTNGNSYYFPRGGSLAMPLEFSVAAYRFGHSMVRSVYPYNVNHADATLGVLFSVTNLSGNLAGQDQLPQKWIIEWENFLPSNSTTINYVNARSIDTRLASPLFTLKKSGGADETAVLAVLAKRNLLRGFLLGLPTGQSVASHVLGPTGVLTPDEILNNATPGERAALLAGNFHIKTPLWYYILAEAAIKAQGQHLGPLGSILVGETLVGLARESQDSILNIEGWQSINGRPTFSLTEFLQTAGVLS